MTSTNGKFYQTPPDMLTLTIKNPPPHGSPEPPPWDPARYRELAGYADAQHAEAVKVLAQFRAEQELVNARHAAVQEAMRHAFTQDDQDRLSAKWLANYPRYMELPGIIAYWERCVHDLHRKAERCRSNAGTIEYRAKKAAEKEQKRQEQAQREAEDADLKKRIIQANWTPQQRARFEAEAHEKATRAQRQAAQEAKRDADRQREEQRHRDAQAWTETKDE